MAGVAVEIRDYNHLIDILQARREDLELSNEAAEEIAGFTTGHVTKILGPRRTKKFGQLTMPTLFEVLGVKLFLLEDKAAAARTIARRSPRQIQHVNSRQHRPKGNAA
jgi:hypothetical protein